jgi:predicted phosphodiesterase
MRALILSDIHANIDALDAVLAAAPPYDVVWNLGDLVGYGAAPSAVMQRARQMGTVFVRGNHDRACCGLIDTRDFNPIALAAVQWTQRQLTEDSKRWLREVPRGPIRPHDAHVSCVHGSLLDEDQYVLSTRDAWQQLAQEHTRLTFFGHTHVQGGFAMSAEGEWFPLKPAYSEDTVAESYQLDLRASATYLINPGSIGQPRDGDWRAAFAVYDEAAQQIIFHRVPYDVRLAQMRIQRAGLPEVLGSRLRVGR